MLICRTTEKEKSRRTADTFLRACGAAALIFRAARAEIAGRTTIAQCLRHIEKVL